MKQRTKTNIDSKKIKIDNNYIYWKIDNLIAL